MPSNPRQYETTKERPEPDEGQVVAELPNEQWVLLRDPDELTNKDRLVVIKAFEQFNGGTASKAMQAVAKFISLFVQDWSYDLPIPKVEMGTLDKIPMRAYDKLAGAVEEHASDTFPDFGPANQSAQSPS